MAVLFEPLVNNEGHSKQQEFIDALFSGKYRFLCYGGAMGGGKTYLSMAIFVLLCRMYPGSRWAVIREDLERIRKTVLPTFEKLAPKGFFSHIKNRNTSPIAVFNNGSQIEFYGENISRDPDGDWLKGLEVNGILLEQLEEIDAKTFDLAFIRAGRWRIDPMPKPFVLATINPTEQWPKEKIYNAWRNDALPDAWYYLPAKISDNPILFNDADYMAGFDNLDPETKARYIDGDWDAFKIDNPFWYLFDEKIHVKEPERNLSSKDYFTYDFGVEPFPSLHLQIDHYTKTVKVFQEFEAPNNDVYSLSDVQSEYMNMFNIPFIHLTGDPSGTARQAAAEGAANYYKILMGALDVPKQNIKVPKKFSIERSKTLCNTVMHNYTFEVSPKCKKLIRDLKYVKVGRNKEGKLTLIKTGGNHAAKASNSELTHFSDALRYALHLEFYDFSSKLRK